MNFYLKLYIGILTFQIFLSNRVLRDSPRSTICHHINSCSRLTWTYVSLYCPQLIFFFLLTVLKISVFFLVSYLMNLFSICVHPFPSIYSFVLPGFSSKNHAGFMRASKNWLQKEEKENIDHRFSVRSYSDSRFQDDPPRPPTVRSTAAVDHCSSSSFRHVKFRRRCVTVWLLTKQVK